MKNLQKEPRLLLDEDSICYGCDYYKHRNDVIFDHVQDDFDENNGCCDVPHLCINGSENSYQKDSNKSWQHGDMHAVNSDGSAGEKIGTCSLLTGHIKK